MKNEDLREIDEDVNVAVELCLLMLSNFTDTYYRVKGIGFDSSPMEKEGWKNLSSVLLREQFPFDPLIYRKILSCLKKGSSKGPIIECDNEYTIGKKCFAYRLAKPYRCKGVAIYQLKTQKAMEVLVERQNMLFSKGNENSICFNLLQFYGRIEIPSLELIELSAKTLLKTKYRTKKGKILTCQGKKSKSYWKQPDERVFIEDHIQIFKFLTSSGLKIPLAGGERSGGRVVDSITLMPSWIRNLIQIDGETLVELDYTCLHPNIAMNLYGGHSEHITHQVVASALNMNVQVVKTEHLSFFNKRWEDMKKSPLYDYYERKEPGMLSQLYEEKTLSQFKHKATSMRLFKKEVEIMTEVIEVLNEQGIYVGYVYDALLCEKRHQDIVRKVMNEVVLENGVFTSCG